MRANGIQNHWHPCRYQLSLKREVLISFDKLIVIKTKFSIEIFELQ